MKSVFLVAAIIGTIVPFRSFIAFLINRGLDATAFLNELTQTNISVFFASDLAISGLVLLLFIFSEGRRLRMSHLWAYVLCTFLVGVSLALPIFLFFRELKLESTKY